ncbi:CHAD domain-containing protein [Paraburkholderia fungorum]|uniref:CHAD domain-containing protein n=1 Tax=Paraburkholderia fungorum TaxID=134537 RepID=A0A1H1IMD1_9BURK|nr:CHAD domain-containing protein [Paraburkholderia fungorum]SDR38895.1 CHAD domain-containing protein [Paraburkholderia fungorum]
MKRDHGKETKQSAVSEPAQRDTSAQAAFVSYAAPLVDHAVEFAGALRDDPSPEALHKLRVSLRRLRSLWWAFEPLLEKSEDQAEASRERAVYKFLATAAGKTRDWDILIELLANKKSGAGELTPRLHDARGAALATSRETLSNADVKHLLHDALSITARELNTSHDRVLLRKFAEKRVAAAERSLKKRMKRARGAKKSNYIAFHNVRKAGKKVRYLLEFFEPVLKGAHKRTLKRLKQIQKRFGALNDVVASEQLLRDNATSIPGSADPSAALDWLRTERKRRIRSAVRLLHKL